MALSRSVTGVITLCGSVRFKDYFEIVNAELTLAGWVVLAPGIFKHDLLHSDIYKSRYTKEYLDVLHKKKIELSDAIFVVDPLNYIGTSTATEISYAKDLGKKIYKWSEGDLQKLMK